MGVSILVVTKEAGGQEWSNTYGIYSGTGTGAATAADIEGIISTNPADGFTPTNTDPGNPAYAGDTSIIAAILGFERALHHQVVTLTRLNLSDATTPGDPSGPFWAQTLSLVCIRDIAAPTPLDAIAPLNIALLANRNTGLIGVRPGRLYYRAVLADSEVKLGSRVGVTWASPAATAAVSGDFEAKVVSSGLSNYFSSPSTTLPPIFLSIPHMSPADEPEVHIIGGAAVNGLRVNKPVSRQLTRGRRRQAAA